MLDNLEKLNSLLSKVTDNDSAEKSASEIKKIGDKLNSIKKDIASKKKTLSDEEQKKVEGQYTEKAEEISMAFFGNLLRINNIEISSSEWEQALAVIEACMNSEQDSANTDSADKAPQPEA